MENAMLHRKEAIILTTIDLIDECGIQKLSTREIARRQGISEGTIFKHFHTKNELILAVLDHFSMFDNEIIQTIKIRKMKSKDAIMYFVSTYVEYYENYPSITAITQAYDVLACEPELAVKARSIFTNRTDFIKSMIEEAQKKGELCPEVDSENLADVIMGFCNSICLKWRLNGYDFSLKERTISTLQMILKAFNK